MKKNKKSNVNDFSQNHSILDKIWSGILCVIGLVWLAFFIPSFCLHLINDPIYSALNIDKNTDTVYVQSVIPFPKKNYITHVSDVKSIEVLNKKRHSVSGRRSFNQYSIELHLKDGQEISLADYFPAYYEFNATKFASKVSYCIANKNEQTCKFYWFSVSTFLRDSGILLFLLFLIYCLFQDKKSKKEK